MKKYSGLSSAAVMIGALRVKIVYVFYFQAEELNTIIGNAFKMAYAQQKVRQPTFNELIEQQLVEQKAKYVEYQEQAQKTLQQKLTEIATPTALQRMEMRRQSSSDELSSINSPGNEREFVVGNKKVWVGNGLYRNSRLNSSCIIYINLSLK